MEQYGRQNFEFVGIPYEKNENINQIVSNLAEKIGVSIKDEDISIVHQIEASQNAQPEKPPNVIVQQMTHFFINENLNAKKELSWKTEQNARIGLSLYMDQQQ